MGKPRSAVEKFVDENSITSLQNVIGFSNAVLTDYVKGRMTKTEAANILHVLETGPARHIHATIEQAAKVGHGLGAIIGISHPKQLTTTISESQSVGGVYEE